MTRPNYIDPRPDQATANAIANICARGHGYDASLLDQMLKDRMAAMGITEDSPYILQSLGRQCATLELSHIRLMEEAALETHPGKQATKYRSAKMVWKMLHDTLSALYRVQTDMKLLPVARAVLEP